MLKLIKIRAFTLAETLIALAVIGVIAAITIPAFIAKEQQMQFVVAWKKAYSNINQAQKLIMNDNGSNFQAGFGNIDSSSAGGNNFVNGFAPYLKYTKICYATKVISDGCYTVSIKPLMSGYTVGDYPGNSVTTALVLHDGMVLLFYAGYSSDVTKKFSADSHIIVDVNGNKLPNTMGKDVFDMYFDSVSGIFISNKWAGTNCDNAGWSCGTYYLIN